MCLPISNNGAHKEASAWQGMHMTLRIGFVPGCIRIGHWYFRLGVIEGDQFENILISNHHSPYSTAAPMLLRSLDSTPIPDIDESILELKHDDTARARHASLRRIILLTPNVVNGTPAPNDTDSEGCCC